MWGVDSSGDNIAPIKQENKGIVILSVMMFSILTISFAIVGIVDTVIIFVFGTFTGCAVLMLLIFSELMEV